MDPNNPTPQPNPSLQNVENPLKAMRSGEQVLCEIKRHPIGIIGVYLSSIIVIGLVLSAVILLPGRINNITSQDKGALLLGAMIIIAIVLLYSYVAHIVYTGNRWILTDDSLTQVTQTGLFRKHSSQLSLANLEDITADQNGIIQSLIGYGDLRAETAGERSKFVFPYCPKPNDYARQILQAREKFIMDNPEQAKRANDKLSVPMGGQTSADPQAAQAPQIDPEQYQQFLQYQQTMAQQQAPQQPDVTAQPAPQATVAQQPAYPPTAGAQQQPPQAHDSTEESQSLPGEQPHQ